MLFPSRDPESLGGEEPLLGGEHRRGRWTRGWGEWVHDNQNKILKTILLLLALLAGIGFIVNVAKGHQRPKKVCSYSIVAIDLLADNVQGPIQADTHEARPRSPSSPSFVSIRHEVFGTIWV